MDLNFRNFLSESKTICKTKTDFVNRIIEEEESVRNDTSEHGFKEKDLYLRRLDNAKFCTEHGGMKERDTFNQDLIELLDKLE
jgi:hypothetical protein